MAAIKCIIRQDWETRNASGELLDRHNCVYVTNEDGTPHVYNSIKEARAEIVSNYGRDANKHGILHNHSVDDYSGNVHNGYIFIVREDTDEFTEATKSSEAEQQAEAERAEIIAEQARELYRDTIYSAITANDIEQAGAYTSDHLKLTVEVMDALGVFHVSDRMLVAIAQVMRWTLEDLEAQAIEEAHDRATAALINAYAEAIGDDVTADDPESIAAHRVARACIGLTTATDDDRATVSAMVEAIADRAREQAEPATVTAYEYILATTRTESGYRCTVIDRDTGDVDEIATAPTATEAIERAAALIDAAFVCDETSSAHDAAAGIVALALDKLDAAGIQETPEQRARLEEYARDYVKASPRDYWEDEPDDEPAPRDIYQRFELLAYLGEPDAYDVDAIEAEATEYDPKTGRTYWRRGVDLAAIAERNELYSYAPAI